ncbi:hypothetical protein C6P45_005514 [Maudiozyma exigua]|uniref:RecA family profile 1 domain-containing protein n=1 Tax=Maudiozyma exigua TaxID=34358 RepID=A0A9P6W7S7_MAUEX|nr:hypothetical protein C6P45_005514 [Kazachstania exigua]
MSFGVPLSQLIVEKPKPLHTGYPELDTILGGGLQSSNIYEIFGPPGIGKTQFGIELAIKSHERNAEDAILWIETFIPLATHLIADPIIGSISNVQITKFTELLIFFTKLIRDEVQTYKTIIIDGFSQILVNHLNCLMTRDRETSGNKLNIHDIKCRDLILLFSTMTKYCNKNKSIIILLNNCMNTSYKTDFMNNNSMNNNGSGYEETFDVVEGGNNFLVSSTMSSSTITSGNGTSFNSINYDPMYTGKRNVQMLKSSLIANSGMGSKDSKWEIFIKARIGLFWDWNRLNHNEQNKKFKIPKRGRIAIVYDDLGSNGDHQNSRNNSIGKIIELPITYESIHGKFGDSIMENDKINSHGVHEEYPEIQLNENNSSNPTSRISLTSTPLVSNGTLTASTVSISTEGTENDRIIGDSEGEEDEINILS